MERDNDSSFSKKFTLIEKVWVGKIEIPVDLTVEKEVKKITQVKSFNMERLWLLENLESSCVTIFVLVKSARLGMCQVVLTGKMVPTSILVLEKENKNRSTGKNRGKTVQVYFLSPRNEWNLVNNLYNSYGLFHEYGQGGVRWGWWLQFGMWLPHISVLIRSVHPGSYWFPSGHI